MDINQASEKIVEIYQKPVRMLPGVGDKTAKTLEKLEIYTIYDLINHFPRAWLDMRQMTQLNRLSFGDLAIISGSLSDIGIFVTKKRGMKVLKAEIHTDSGAISAFWFNQVYLKNSLEKTKNAIFVGKFEYNGTFGKFIANPKIYQKREILPIYPLTMGLSQYMIRKTIQIALTAIEAKDFLTQEEASELNLIALDKAFREIHGPENQESLNMAKRRLAFDEMFYVNINLTQKKKNEFQRKAIIFKPNYELIKKLIKKLPFQLTGSQKKEIYVLSKELAQDQPMQRLLQGDVGSGKTIVAALAALQVIEAGYQVVCMAPTEILARQHYETFLSLMDKKYKIALVVGSEKHDWENADIVIGTQALIQKSINFPRLGFVIIDEQHRFGINQRNMLTAKKNGLYPHYLAMSATPIPRSLAQIMYGHLELGRIDEMPEGRKKIETKLFSEIDRNKIYTFVDEIIKRGEQVFVVCPKIEPNDILSEESTGQEFLDFDRKSAIEEYEKLKNGFFKNRRIALLHGKMKNNEKNEILNDFRDKKYDILVSTAVIEVGIDIPNVSVIIIESAERFGMAQLHQFRGRVGRGGQQAYCFLNVQNTLSRNRITIMEKEHNGFKLAEFDLKYRGPGDFIGVRQSGLPDFKMAEFTNVEMLDKAKNCAKQYLKNHPKNNRLLDYYEEEFFKKNKV